jgi:hypothetical protein
MHNYNPSYWVGGTEIGGLWLKASLDKRIRPYLKNKLELGVWLK